MKPLSHGAGRPAVLHCPPLEWSPLERSGLECPGLEGAVCKLPVRE
jgi:hypothetical protein